MGWPATATVPCDVLHWLHADWKALISAVETCTDLRLPWLNRERGSCFIHRQKESTEGEVPPAQEGRGHSHTSKSASACAWGLREGGGTSMGCGCQRITLQSNTHTLTHIYRSLFLCELFYAFKRSPADMWQRLPGSDYNKRQRIKMENKTTVLSMCKGCVIWLERLKKRRLL